MGADDYLAKPFNPRELLARINAVLSAARRPRRRSAPPHGASALSFLGWRIDFRLRELRNPAGARVAMTSAEFDLFTYVLRERPGRVLSRDSLLDLTQGRSSGSFERSIDVLVSRIRRKIEPDPQDATMIKTVRSGGYMFTPNGGSGRSFRPHAVMRLFGFFNLRGISGQIAALVVAFDCRPSFDHHRDLSDLTGRTSPTRSSTVTTASSRPTSSFSDAAPASERPRLIADIDRAFPQLDIESVASGTAAEAHKPASFAQRMLYRHLGSNYRIVAHSNRLAMPARSASCCRTAR